MTHLSAVVLGWGLTLAVLTAIAAAGGHLAEWETTARALAGALMGG